MNITDNLKDKKYVAFLDVLGFKELLIENGDRLNIYFNTIDNALIDIGQDKRNIKSQIVSDSTILSCPLTNEDLGLLLKAVQTIQARCALENIWIRGAITIGEILFDRRLNIVVGKGLSDAYVLESQEKYPRVIIDPKVISNGFKTREAFKKEYNKFKRHIEMDPENVPLIHDCWLPEKRTADDAFFVAFAERIAFDSNDNLEIVYRNIKSELYKGQTHYAKYLWLKNYFADALPCFSMKLNGVMGNVSEKQNQLDQFYSKFIEL